MNKLTKTRVSSRTPPAHPVPYCLTTTTTVVSITPQSPHHRRHRVVLSVGLDYNNSSIVSARSAVYGECGLLLALASGSYP